MICNSVFLSHYLHSRSIHFDAVIREKTVLVLKIVESPPLVHRLQNHGYLQNTYGGQEILIQKEYETSIKDIPKYPHAKIGSP